MTDRQDRQAQPSRLDPRGRERCRPFGVVLRNKQWEEGVASKFVKAFNIRCTHVRQVIKNLSGGN